MKITNKHGLPPEVYDALCKDRYAGDDEDSDLKTDYSATTLVAPVQQTILKRRYPGCNTEDAIDRVWSMFGSIAHSLLEEHGSEGSVIEKRFYAKILGKVVSTRVDHYKDNIVTDYKVTKAYKVLKKSFDDWSKQLNIIATIFEANNIQVNGHRIIAIIRDWDENESFKQDYPKAPIQIIPLVKWCYNQRKAYLEERVKLLIDNEGRPDNRLTPCTEEERWMNFKDFAVMKKGATRATKVFEDEQQAIDDATKRGPDYLVKRRTSEPRRCLRYCAASSKCVQHQDWLKSQEQKGE